MAWESSFRALVAVLLYRCSSGSDLPGDGGGTCSSEFFQRGQRMWLGRGGFGLSWFVLGVVACAP